MGGLEVLVTLIVAVIVFGPKQLTTILQHISKFNVTMRRYQQNFYTLLQDQENTQQLQTNLIKAAQADAVYREQS